MEATQESTPQRQELDELWAQFNECHPLLTLEELEEISRILFATQGIRAIRAGLIMLTQSGREPLEKLHGDPEMVGVYREVAQVAKDRAERLRGVAEALDTARARLLMALCDAQECPMSKSADHPSLESVDDASLRLGMAHALGQMCCDASGQLTDSPDEDITGIWAAVRHMASLVGEAKELMAGLEPLERAHAVCRLVAAQVGTQSARRVARHCSSDVTDFSLRAVCDAIEQAKAAVDDIVLPIYEEVSHG